ncbi:hypothetical protein F5Y10DRAFT_272872 [Nemania abortiva]|nr:hypothetical protein F5Y10DRAFT_272872 [Nemania abortiva]
MVPSESALATMLPIVALLSAAISPANAVNDASSLRHREPRTDPGFANGSAVAIASRNGQAMLPPTNKSDAVIIVAASTNHSSPRKDFTRHKRKDSKTKSKKKKPKKNGNKNDNSTDDQADDDESGVGRGVTLPLSLAISLVILVGALQL